MTTCAVGLKGLSGPVEMESSCKNEVLLRAIIPAVLHFRTCAMVIARLMSLRLPRASIPTRMKYSQTQSRIKTEVCSRSLAMKGISWHRSIEIQSGKQKEQEYGSAYR